ncbi:MAG: cyclic nucleotide-binding domain-containing protein [Sporomusaceae bacterium]|nr:cyclic nucleotide-binding domain-containing protein [Sporomusaceae bacterium]
MELVNTCIYEHIKAYLPVIAIVQYKKGQYILRSEEDFREIYFILEGTVRVECITEYGKSFLVDELSENEFVGKISYIYEQNFSCDMKAVSSVRLLKLDQATFDKLKMNPAFLKLFLYKTSHRIYIMYKKLMMKNLFNSEELFAFYLLQNAEAGRFQFKSVMELCNFFPISRKGLYNVMNRLIAKKIIKKEKNCILILDEAYMAKLAIHVKAFNQEGESTIRLE